MKEFGRTPGCICNVLAVLSDDEESMSATLRKAVELADAHNARLTLVKTCEQGRAYVWVAPFAVGSAYLPPELESPEQAAHVLSRLADQVPASIPVTLLVLTKGTQESLLTLLRKAQFGAVVADADLLTHCWRLRRWLRGEQLYIVPVTRDRPAENGGSVAGQFSTSGLTDGAVDAEKLTEGLRRRWSAGLRPWSGRHLADLPPRTAGAARASWRRS